MATYYALPGEVVDLKIWAQELRNEKSKIIVKTKGMEFVWLFIPTSGQLPHHKVSGLVAIHCTKGKLR